MFKRILNHLLGNDANSSQQALSIEVVRGAVYDLLTNHQTTTTLDVKNELRRSGYQAFQDQVSQMVSAIASHDQLSARNNGKFNVYSYGFDSSETRHVYLECGDQFWEGKLDGKTITVYSGKTGTDGTEETFECYKNLLAVRELERVIEEKIQAGYQLATDKRPSLEIRRQYGHLFGQKPISCSIGYFNVTKQEYTGDFLLTKNAGYTFTWQLNSSRQALEAALNQSNWSSTAIQFDHAQLLGEKVIQKQQVAGQPGTVQLEADNRHIFQVELFFENGEKALISKFGFPVQEALLPLVRQFLN